MLRPIAAGWMCLGFVTLGVAAIWGQDEAGKPRSVDLIAVEEEKAAAPGNVLVPLREVDARRIEIRIGDDSAAAVAGEGEDKRVEVREGGEVFILNERDGKIVEKFKADAVPGRSGVRVRFAQGPAIDAGTREAVDKLIAGLKDEAKRLSGDGKKEEAGKKFQSIQALEQMLNAGPRWGAYAPQPVPSGGVMAGGIARFREVGPVPEELKKLHARLEELRALLAQASKTQSGEEHAKIEEEIAKIQKQIAESAQRMSIATGGIGAFPPGAPGAPMSPFAPGHPVPPGPGGGVAFTVSPEADALAQKAQALSGAATQLRQAGLEDQARELDQQSAKLRAEAFEKVRARTQHVPGTVHFTAGPPQELQRSIHELQEQIQQLRKEVAELRELLQRRQ
jgi:hypothetical protein